MKEPLELIISGIKCDVCSYRDNTVEFMDYPKWLNKPCPECQSNLLTQKDYDRCLRDMKIVERLKQIGTVLRWINPFHYWRLIFGDKRVLVTLIHKKK